MALPAELNVMLNQNIFKLPNEITLKMRHKIPVFRFSLVQAGIAVFMQLLTIVAASLFVAGGDFSSISAMGMFFIFALLVIGIAYFVIGAISALAFNKICDTKKKIFPTIYAAFAETALFFGIGALKSWTDALTLALQTLVIAGVTLIILFRFGKKEEAKTGKAKKEKHLKSKKKHRR